MLAQDRRLGDEGRQRRPQLVRDVGDEAPVLGFGRLEPADGLGQRLGHPVEAVRPRPELVVRGDRHARRQVAVLDRLGGTAGGLDRGQDPARDGPGHEQGDEDQRDGADGEGRPELAERLVDGGHVVDEVEGRPRAADAAADDEARPPGDLGPGVGELAGVDALREVGGKRADRADEVGPRDDRLAVADVDDGVDAALQEGLPEAAVDDRRRASARPAVRGSGTVTARSKRAWAAASRRT